MEMVQRSFNRKIDFMQNEYRKSHVSAIPIDTAVGNGLTVQYPSATQTTICTDRDIYIIGKIDDSVTVADDWTLRFTLTQVSTNVVVRDVSTSIKNNTAGINVDYDGIIIGDGSDEDKEAFRNAGMPDLVYDPDNPDSFYDTWNKCFYTDTWFAGLFFGGAYTTDINTVDQNGNTLTALEEGEYVVYVSFEGTPYYVQQLITIGTLPNKMLGRFHPLDTRERLIQESADMNYTMFLDPFPGYWDTMMFNPEWGVDYIAENATKWKYNDAMEYVAGKIQFYAYDITETSTSFSVELGQLQYDRVIDNHRRLASRYYSFGEPTVFRTDESQNIVSKFWRFDDRPDGYGPAVFARADILDTDETNTINRDNMAELECYFDMANIPCKVGDYVALNGVCMPVQAVDAQRDPATSTFTGNNRVAQIGYYWSLSDKPIPLRAVPAEEALPTIFPVTLARSFTEDGEAQTVNANMEFRHCIQVQEDWANKRVIITYVAYDVENEILNDGIHAPAVTLYVD